jgi:hypothetical protein
VKDGGQTQRKRQERSFQVDDRHKGRSNQRERTHLNNVKISRGRRQRQRERGTKAKNEVKEVKVKGS